MRTKIKYIAVIAMLLNHIAHIFMEPGTVPAILLTSVGYFTAPVMCYFLVEGFAYTHSRIRYGMRLLLCAFISQIPFRLVFGPGTLNMMFTLFLGFIALCCMEHAENSPVSCACVFWLITVSLLCDWPIVALVLIIMLYVSRTNKERTYSFIVCGVFVELFTFLNYMEQSGYTILSAFMLSVLCEAAVLVAGYVILHFYEEKEEKHTSKINKWFFYLFYPAHLAILYLINL